VHNPTVGHIIWTNASATGSGGQLTPGVTSVTIPNVEANTQLGFFLIPNANSLLQASHTTIGDTVYFHDGKTYADSGFTHIINSDGGLSGTNANPTWFSNSQNIDGLQHVITGVTASNDNSLYVGFEDKSGGDSDYNDVILKVDLGSGNTVQVNPASFDVGASIQHTTGSADVNHAVLSFTLGDGDTVSYTPVSGLSVVHSGNSYTITGNAPVDSYNTLIDSFHIAVGHSGVNESYLSVDPVTRTASLQLWDTFGNQTDVKTAQFDLNMHIVGTSGNETLTGTAGNDTLTGNGGHDVFVATKGADHITDFIVKGAPGSTSGDTLDISTLLANATRDNLVVGADGAHAKITIVDSTPSHTVLGSVTFDNISSASAPSLDSLLGQVDVKDSTHHIT